MLPSSTVAHSGQPPSARQCGRLQSAACPAGLLVVSSANLDESQQYSKAGRKMTDVETGRGQHTARNHAEQRRHTRPHSSTLAQKNGASFIQWRRGECWYERMLRVGGIRGLNSGPAGGKDPVETEALG